MSYAIVRNEKLTRSKAQGICVHNDRKAKNHSNKEIDKSRTPLNYYLKKNDLNYVKAFDRLKEENNLKGQIRKNSIIMCEMIFTSDSQFFNEIGQEETKRYFQESYNFVCQYKELGEKNIISAVVHLDEGTPHMHLAYIPVIKTTDKAGTPIDKVCCKEFWKGSDSYRNLQNAYYEYVTSKGFNLERGLPVEETGRKHENLEDFKNLTNFKETKQLLNNITLELPEVPDLKDFRKVMLNRDEKIVDEIIKPKDELIQELHQENLSLHTQLSKQAKLIDTVSEFNKERKKILNENFDLNRKCQKLSNQLQEQEKKLKTQYNDKIYDLEYGYKKKIKKLENENKNLKKAIEKVKSKVHQFIKWICKKFELPSEDEVVRDFQIENNTSFNIDKMLDTKKLENSNKHYEIEL